MEHIPEVTVIVVTYNQEWHKLEKTLGSILVQEGISFEVVVCDDGSDRMFEREMKQYFLENAFANYRLVFHEHNVGTVSNYYSGLSVAKGKYSKLLGAGDYLAERHTLYKWVEFMENNNAEWSFSDTRYYRRVNDKEVVISAKARPQILAPYFRNDKSACMWNYVVLHDIANGASILGVTDGQKDYCKMIKEKGIKYCEDHIYQIMMFHGILGVYYPFTAVCYEIGCGISTSDDSLWKERIRQDKRKLLKILSDEMDDTRLKKKMVKGLMWKNEDKQIKKWFLKGYLFFWLKRHFFPRLTPLPEDVWSNHL